MTAALYTYLLEFSLGSLFLYAYYLLAWKNNQAFELKRALLLSILFISVLFPFISIETNSISAIAGSFQLEGIEINNSQSGNSFPTVSWSLILLAIYFLGIFISLIHGLKGLWQILVIRLSSKSEFKGDHNLVKIEGNFPTFSFLNTLYWNTKTPLEESEEEMIYSHEMTHIRQFHSMDLIFISICRILFWFNPIVHLLYKEMALVHECIADREVLKKYSPGNYLSLLANQTIYNMQHQWINQFASVSSLKRMRAIKNARRSPVLLRLLVMIPLIAILFTAISCENSVETADENMESQQTEILTEAQEMPSFDGGMDALISYMTENVKYPESAKEAGTVGKVFVSFVVEKDGTISNAEIVKGASSDLDDEALRVVESMPKWNPGSVDGELVRVRMTLPISFAL